MTLYVPERKVWTSQPKNTGINWANPITAGLEFAFNPAIGFVDQVSGRLLSTTGKVDVRPRLGVLGAYSSASSDVLSCTLAKPIPTTGAVSVFELISVDNSDTTRKRSVRLSGATGTVLAHEYTTTGLDETTYQDSTGVFPVNNFASYSANTLYSYYIAHLDGDTNPRFARNRVVAFNNPLPGNGTRKEVITTVYIGNNSSAMPLLGNSNLVLVFSRLLSANERTSLEQNPWQLFAPRRQWFALSQVTNVQLLYPSSDISTGSWTPSTGTTLYGVLDETVADNSDYIEAVIPTSCEIKLEAGAAPLIKTNHTLKYTLLSGSGSITVKLVEGTSVIKTWNHALTGSAQNISSALSEAEAQTITNYADLRVRFET